MVDEFDIEKLKVHKIEAKKKPRLHLPIAGALPPLEDGADVDEARGGTGERSEVVAPEELETRVLDALRTVYDPEIPLNVYDLGLIYRVDVSADGDVEIDMTLTAPACPVAGQIVQEVARKSGAVEGVRESHVKLVWDPPWTRERMTDEALLELGLL